MEYPADFWRSLDMVQNVRLEQLYVLFERPFTSLLLNTPTGLPMGSVSSEFVLAIRS